MYSGTLSFYKVMAILGTILKSTARIGTQFDERKRFDYSLQTKVLQKLLEKAKNTAFGRHHEFQRILVDDSPIHAFSQNIPITTYDDFYSMWLKNGLNGAKDNTWPGKIKYVALSSGTSGAPSKRIPVSEHMIKNFQRVSLNQMLTLHDYGMPTDFYEKSMLIIGGSSQLKQTEHYKEGDLSGILAGKIPFWFSAFSKPVKTISRLPNWDAKLEAIVEAAPNWDIGTISGVPAWVEMVLKAIIRQYNLNTIHDIWPSLRVYVHGGVAIEPYKKELDKLFGQPIIYQETYLASEGYFAYQKGGNKTGMRLLLNSGVYFEFVPFTAENFSEQGELKADAIALPLHKVQENTDYALVVSTCSGLWRYLIGDTIRFTSLLDYEIKITGRVSQFLNVCGEHLSVENMNAAVHAAAIRLGISIPEYTVYSVKNGTIKHHWYLGVDKIISDQEIALIIDEELKSINDDYAAVRKHTLEKPLVTVIPSAYFLNFLAKKGKLGGQNKFPRVMKLNQLEEWKAFLG